MYLYKKQENVIVRFVVNIQTFPTFFAINKSSWELTRVCGSKQKARLDTC